MSVVRSFSIFLITNFDAVCREGSSSIIIQRHNSLTSLSKILENTLFVAMQKVRTLRCGGGGTQKAQESVHGGGGVFKERTYAHVIFKCYVLAKHPK